MKKRTHRTRCVWARAGTGPQWRHRTAFRLDGDPSCCGTQIPLSGPMWRRRPTASARRWRASGFAAGKTRHHGLGRRARHRHAWPTLDQGGTCNVTEAPFIGACEFDASGEMLAALYGPAPTPATGVTAGYSFNQDAYRPDGEDAFLSGGFPRAGTAPGKSAARLLAFHGCEQNGRMVSDKFILGKVTEPLGRAYDLVVVYPPDRASFMPLNRRRAGTGGVIPARTMTPQRRADARLANLTAALGIPLQPDRAGPSSSM